MVIITQLTLLTLLTLLARLPVPHHGPTPPAAQLTALVDSLRVAGKVPALAAVVLNADSMIVAAVGLRRANGPERVGPDDRFHLGSNGKAMTATMIAQLVHDNRLSWNATPADVFPEDSASFTPALRHVTLTQLFGHSAGLEGFEDLDDLPKGIRGASGGATGRRQFAAWVLRSKAAYPPGSQHLYSNAGPAIAAAMAERVTGRPWEDLMRSLVFEPLGMRAGFGWPAADDPHQPWGHGEKWFWRQAFGPRDSYRIPAALAPAGDMNATMRDYGRFVQMHLRGLEARDDVLPAAEIAQLHRVIPPDARAGPHYAMGWGIQLVDSVESHVHAGSAGTFDALVAIQPGCNLAVAVATNAGDDKADAAARAAFKLLLRRYRAFGGRCRADERD